MKTERILQISNDISENMCNATAKELIEVVKYFRNQLDKRIQRHNNKSLIAAGKLIGLAARLMKP
jgi:sugar-specific transcriptional regulator TrmB